MIWTMPNILLALADAKHKRHRKVSSWFNELPIGSHMLICRVAQLGLIRLITSNVVMQGEALTMREAWAFYGELLQVPSIYFVDEPGRIQAHWFKSCLAFEQATKRVTDAYLAVLLSGERSQFFGIRDCRILRS
jgi:uncharacterized protein